MLYHSVWRAEALLRKVKHWSNETKLLHASGMQKKCLHHNSVEGDTPSTAIDRSEERAVVVRTGKKW